MQVPLPVHDSPAHWLHFASITPVLVAATLDFVVLELVAFEVEVAVLAELVDVLFAELVVETDPPLFETLKIAMS